MASFDGAPQGRVTRRAMLAGSALVPTLALLPSTARADTASVVDPSMAGPLGDVWLGSADAKVTLVEYAAVTCTHCAAFHDKTLPGIKARWIDSGRVRFALRGFLLSPLDTAAFMLARHDGAKHFYAITDLLFERQSQWAFVPKPLDALRDLLRQAGIDNAMFEAVLTDRDLYDHVNRVQAKASADLGVHLTPTLFVNGVRHEGAMSGEAFDGIIGKLPS